MTGPTGAADANHRRSEPGAGGSRPGAPPPATATRLGTGLATGLWRTEVARALRLVLVTDRTLCRRHGVVDTVTAAVSGGATMVQLRDPEAGGRELYELATALLRALDGTGVPLVVNDRPDVALAAGAAGVHVGQSDLPAPVVRALVGPDLCIGLSVTRPHQATEVERWTPGTVDYLGVGPVRATTTKADAAEPLGLDGLRAVVSVSPVPCVAIGGITAEDAGPIVASGAAGVAVVSAICGTADPAAAARRFRQVLP